MFVHLSNAAVLELFRLYREQGSWSRRTALDFLFRFRRDVATIASIRRLLSERRSAAIARLHDEALLQFASTLIVSGQIVVVQEHGGYRWDGRCARVGHGLDRALLMWREGLNGVQDASTHVHCLPAINAVASPIESLKQLLPEWMFDPQVPPDDSELMELLMTAIREGEIVAVYHWPHGHTDVTVQSPQADAPAPASSSAVQEPPESTTFASSHSPADQAATMRGASAAGKPFCEICDRQRRAAAEPT